MNEKKLQKLIKNLISLENETEIVEFKLNNGDKEVVGKYISALANSANLHDLKKAYLVYGVENETHNVVGTLFKPKSQKIGNDPLEFWLNQHVNPSLDFTIHETKFENKDIVVFEIPPAISQPIKFNNLAYIRIGSATPQLSDHSEKEQKIWQNINRNSFEKQIAIEDLSVTNVLELLDYAKFFSLTKQELPTDTQKFVEKMMQYRLVKKNFKNSYDITNLGAILFAKDLNSFSSLKRKAVRVTLYKGNSKVERIKEHLISSGYAISFESLLEYIYDKLPYNEVISQTLRKEVKMYPEIAIREFVANALIHQDLTIHGAGTTIEIFDNRIEITNTGAPLIDTDRFIDHPAISRNEELASFMRQIGVCEEGGTGIDRALINIEIYQLPAPKFEKFTDFTKVTLFAYKELKDMTDSDKVRACYQHCVLKYIELGRMTNASLRKRLEIGERNYPAASTIIKKTIEAGYIKVSEKPKEYIPSWA